MKKNLLTLNDYTDEELLEVIELAIKIKKSPNKFETALKGRTLAMLFAKTSTRTRMSFETGMTKLGGHAIFLDWRTTQLKKAAIKDEIRCIDRYADIIMARVYAHSDVVEMADYAKVPVINALSDDFHPCQIIADLQTIKEHFGKLKGLTLAYIGDGNNVCNSLILGCTKVGMNIVVATPKGYEPKKEIIEQGKKSGLLSITNNPKEASKGADVIYTDTWVSMGQEEEEKKRKKDFHGFTVDKKLLGTALFMHCLPANRGYEVDDYVMDSAQSIIFDQAENRMWGEMAVMLKLMGK